MSRADDVLTGVFRYEGSVRGSVQRSLAKHRQRGLLLEDQTGQRPELKVEAYLDFN